MADPSPGQAPVVCVDGPGGVGKGTLALALAHRLNWHYLDSGALYRVVAALALGEGVELGDGASLTRLAEGLDVRFEGGRVVAGGVDLTEEIRREAVGAAASEVALHPVLRQVVLRWQRTARQAPGLVAEGRDMGTVVFPEAELKIYLGASAEERAHRRHRQLRSKGLHVSLRTVLGAIQERDERDSRRAASPLRPAEDAVLIDSTSMTVDDVLQSVWALVRAHGLGSGEG